jgi:hypothetical protein
MSGGGLRRLRRLPCPRVPAAVADREVSCEGEMPKMAASRPTYWVVKPRCLPLRRPSAAHTVELLIRPVHQLTELCLSPAVLLAKDPDVRADDGRLACGISSTRRRRRPDITHPPAR